MNNAFLLGIGWPDAAHFDSSYPLASAIPLIVAIWFMALLKRTADQHYRLLREERLAREEELEAVKREKTDPGEAPLFIAISAILAFASTPARAEDPRGPAPSLTVGAFVETYFGWNFNRPGNGVTAFRGFDARHDSFALSNAVIDTHWTTGPVSGRVALQTGDTPDIYYGFEATSDVRHILEATVAWKAPVGKGPRRRRRHLPLAHRPRSHSG